MLIATIGGLIYFVVMPTISDIKKMGEEIENQRIDLEQKYIKGQSLRKLTENLKKIEPQLVVLDQIFISQNHELEFITALEELANQNNISQKINLQELPKDGNKAYQKTPLQISAKGNFINLMNYLIDLEALNYYININSINLSSAYTAPSAASDEQTVFSNINIALSADTYWK